MYCNMLDLLPEWRNLRRWGSYYRSRDRWRARACFEEYLSQFYIQYQMYCNMQDIIPVWRSLMRWGSYYHSRARLRARGCFGSTLANLHPIPNVLQYAGFLTCMEKFEALRKLLSKQRPVEGTRLLSSFLPLVAARFLMTNQYSTVSFV